MAEETNEDRFFLTFESILKSVAGDKMKNPKWAKKLKNFQVIVQFHLLMDETNSMYCYFTADKGTFNVLRGPAPFFDLEFTATPDDLFNFTNRTYGTVSMVLKKNIYGHPRLKIKKGGRQPFRLLKVAKLLVVD